SLRKGRRAWVSALRRDQGGERAGVNVLQREFDGVIKVQPLALTSREWVDEQLRTLGLPQHPLLGKGYRSVGCEPCTQATKPGESERAGRWAGHNKTECGLHKRQSARQAEGAVS